MNPSGTGKANVLLKANQNLIESRDPTVGRIQPSLVIVNRDLLKKNHLVAMIPSTYVTWQDVEDNIPSIEIYKVTKDEDSIIFTSL